MQAGCQRVDQRVRAIVVRSVRSSGADARRSNVEVVQLPLPKEEGWGEGARYARRLPLPKGEGRGEGARGARSWPPRSARFSLTCWAGCPNAASAWMRKSGRALARPLPPEEVNRGGSLFPTVALARNARPSHR
jgi:hypothetical protein